jgi:hypothetical protein
MADTKPTETKQAEAQESTIVDEKTAKAIEQEFYETSRVRRGYTLQNTARGLVITKVGK